jgi:hypothetical protein
MRVAQLVFMEFVSQRLKVTILLAAIAQFYLDLLHLFQCFFHLTRIFFDAGIPPRMLSPDTDNSFQAACS